MWERNQNGTWSPKLISWWTDESATAAIPASGELNPIDQKHIDLAIRCQFQLAWNELWFRRTDLQLQLLAACPKLAHGGEGGQKIHYEFGASMNAPKKRTIGYCYCWPAPFTMALEVAMLGITGKQEKSRAYFARYIPLIFQAREIEVLPTGEWVAKTEARARQLRALT